MNGSLTADVFTREHRVQAGHGLLEDNGNLGCRGCEYICSVVSLVRSCPSKVTVAAGDIAVGIQQPQDAHGGDGLAGTGLAHDTQSLTGVNGIGNVVDSLDNAVSGFEKGIEVLDFQQRLYLMSRHYLSTSDLGSSTSRRVSPMMLMQMTTMERNSAGNSQRHQ